MTPRRTILGFDRTVFWLGVTSLLNDISSEIIYPLLPTFLTTVLGGGPGALGLIEGVAESTSSLLKLVSGWLSDRLAKRKGLVAAGYTIAAVCRPLIAVTSAPWQLLVIRFADRTGKGLRAAPRDALLAESSTPLAWGRSFGFHRSMDHLGAVIGPLIAFVLTAVFAEGYRLIFALAAVPGMIAVAALCFGVREPARPPATERALPAAAHGPLPRQLSLFLVPLAIFTLGNSTDAFLLLRAQNLGVRVATLPLLWMLLHAVKSATSLPAGSLSDRIGRQRVILSGWAVYAAVYLGFAQARSTAEIWLLFAAYGLYFGLTEGVEKALVADLVSPAYRGASFGVYHLTVGVTALPASVIFGLLWAWRGPALAFRTGAALATLAAALLLALRPGRSRSTPAQS